MAWTIHRYSIELTGHSTECLARLIRDAPAFSFALIEPEPDGLVLEASNLVDTGFCALFGEWQRVADQWMLKKEASDRGLSFPLESRLQVVECLQSIEFGKTYIELGNAYQENLNRYGFGTINEWRKENWGTANDCWQASAVLETDFISVSFLCDSRPEPLIHKLKEMCPKCKIVVERGKN